MGGLLRTLLRTAPLIHRRATPGGVLKRAKYCLLGLAFARLTGEWFDFLQSSEMEFIAGNNPCLFHKLQRPYLHRSLPTNARLQALKQHYQFILSQFPSAMIEEVYAPAGKLLAALPVEEVGTLELRLLCGKMQKEGDLTISLAIKETQKQVGTLSFSVWKCESTRKEIFIGGLQGDKATSEDVVVSITRGLDGLRPKALLFFVLQQLAAGWKITTMQAVSDDMHIYRHFQSRRNVAASYDKFWLECGGIFGLDGLFHLPAAFVPREISTIRANKRQLYRRRYAMLRNLSAQIAARLSSQEVPACRENVPQLTEKDLAPQVIKAAA